MDVLIFNVWADVGFFRKIYTTSSPLTYPFMPKPTIMGFLAAVLGLRRDKYYEDFSEEKCAIALCLKNPVKKIKFNTNLLDTKSPPNDYYTQVGYEILKEPAYRIFFWHENDGIMSRIENQLREHKSVYTCTLGLANCLANFQYIGRSEIKSTELQEADSVINLNALQKVLEYGEYFKVKMPSELGAERIPKKYGEYLYERNGGKIKAVCGGFIVKQTDEKIVML